MRKVKLFLIVFLLVLTFNLCTAGYSGDKSLVYVAGNPNLYPLEYYDEVTGNYKGVIPDILSEFSARGNYEILYINPGKKDKRHDLANNLQADLISGCQISDGFDAQAWQQGLVVLNYDVNGEAYEYRILFTEAATEELINELKEYILDITDSRINGLLISNTEKPKSNISTHILIILLTVIAVLLVVILICYIIHREKTQLLIRESETDLITGIGNYRYLVNHYKRSASYNRIFYTAIYLRIDLEKIGSISEITDKYDILKHTAKVIENYKNEADVIARVAYGSFVMLKKSAKETDIEKYLDNVINEVQDYIRGITGSNVLYCNAGIYDIKSKSTELDEVIYNAEQGCIDAVKKGNLFTYCTRTIIDVSKNEKNIQNHIERAFNNNEIELFLHFFVAPSSNRIVGAEALSRWVHPERGLLLPDKFIYLMEKEGAISKLDYYILEKTCGFLEMLNSNGINDFFVACNFSRVTLSSDEFVANAMTIVKKYNFNYNSLILEMTENIFQNNNDLIYANLASIAKQGLRIVIDDFGRGCSSFDDVQKYNFNGIKLDKSLIDNVNTERGKTILKGIIAIGHDLGMTVLGEGVETSLQVDILADIDCDVLQGYYYYYPLPLKEAQTVIFNNRKGN